MPPSWTTSKEPNNMHRQIKPGPLVDLALAPAEELLVEELQVAPVVLTHLDEIYMYMPPNLSTGEKNQSRKM